MFEEAYLVRVKYFVSDEPSQYLVNGIGELAKLTNLLSKTGRYSLVSVERLGKIDDYDGLIDELIDYQKPEGLDCG